MHQRYIIPALLTTLLLPTLLHSQELDDHWSSEFQLPGFHADVDMAAVDDRGRIIVRRYYDHDADGSPFYYYEDGSWHHLPINSDTIENDGGILVVDAASKARLFSNGDIIANAKSPDHNGWHSVRLDINTGEWDYFLPYNADWTVLGEDGDYYQLVPEEGSAGWESYSLVRLQKSGLTTITAGIPRGMSLLGVSGNSTPFLTSKSHDSIYWIDRDGITGVAFPSSKVTFSEFLGIEFGMESLLIPATISTASQSSGSTILSTIYRVVPGESIQQIDLPEGMLMPFLVAQDAARMPGHAILEKPDGTIVVPTDRGLYSWDERVWTLLSDSFTGRFMVETPSGELIVHSRVGPPHGLQDISDVALFNPEEGSWTYLFDQSREYRGLLEPGTFMEVTGGTISIGMGEALAEEGIVKGDVIRYQNGSWTSELAANEIPDFREVKTISDGSDGIYSIGTLPMVGTGIQPVALYHVTPRGVERIGDSTTFVNSNYPNPEICLHQGVPHAATIYRTGDQQLRSRIQRYVNGRWEVLYEGLHINRPHLLSDGVDLYIGGDILENPEGIARVEGGVLHYLGKGVSGMGAHHVTSIARSDDDLFVGGAFQSVNGSFQFDDADTSFGVARWDGAKWHSLEKGVFSSNGALFSGHEIVTHVAVSGENVIVAGDFDGAGAIDAASPSHVDLSAGLAFWDRSMQTWNTFGSGLTDPFDGDLHGTVTDLEVHGDTLWVQGDFSWAGGKRADGIARFIIPSPHVNAPEMPAVVDFGRVSRTQVAVAWLPIRNPSTSTRTMRGRVGGLDAPYSIDFDGEFQAASGQMKMIRIELDPDRNGEILDTLHITWNGSTDEAIPVILRARIETSGVDVQNGSTGELDLTTGPQPVRDESTLCLTLPHPGKVSISLFQVDGRLVRDLYQGPADNATSIYWSREDLPSGPYLVHVIFEGQAMTRKIILE